jgi:hypothetical protein
MTGCVISPRIANTGSATSGGRQEFTLSADPNPQQVSLGSIAVYTVNVVAQNGFTGTVNLTLGATPSSVSAALGQSSIAGGSGAVTLSVLTFSNSTLGDTSFTLTGTDPSNNQSQTITVTVTITN